MVLFSLNLSDGKRLNISINNRRDKPLEKSLLNTVVNVFKSNRKRKHRILIRKLFEHSKIKKIFGANLAIIAVVSVFIPSSNNLLAKNININSVSGNVNFETKQGVRNPTNNLKITQGYGIFHKGYDFDGKTGDPVYPIMEGAVKTIEISKYGYGKSIVINHGNKTESRYAHLSEIEVEEGQEVTNETEIGKMGATGKAVGDHLHLEVYENGKTVNPSQILPHQ